MKTVRVVLVAASTILTVGIAGLPAQASAPLGTCTNSYDPYSLEQWLAVAPDGTEIFGVIDTNHDGVICFKWYPNGDHNGHIGNLVDDKAAPHQ
jgi:hypothetical protein